MHYYRARWYDGKLGRFISEDPIGLAGGDINLYGYVHNNSINKTDPFGLLDPIIGQDPAQYNQDFNKLSCQLGNKNPWIGIEPGASFHGIWAGYGASGGVEINPLTGETCLFVKSTPRVGLGLFAGAGVKINVDFQGRSQPDGWSVQPELAGDLGLSKGGKGRLQGGGFVTPPVSRADYGGDVSTSGVGIGVGPGIGLGVAVGVDIVNKRVWCFNKPPDCECQK